MTKPDWRDIWVNDNTNLFRSDSYDPEIRIFCNSIEIEAIEWNSPEESCNICAYCHHKYYTMDCPGCGARQPMRNIWLGKASVTLQGLLPKSSWLLDIRPNTVLEISYRDCGAPGYYHKDEVIIVMTNCETVKKSIPFPVLGGEGSTDLVVATTAITCDVELWLNVEVGNDD